MRSETSKAVALSPWTFITAVWTRSKPEPVTTMFLPPLKHTHKHANTPKTQKSAHMNIDAEHYEKTDMGSSIAPGVIFNRHGNKLV